MPSEQSVVMPIQDSEGELLLSHRRTSDKPSLLDLPLELRVLVYSYVFHDAVIEIRLSSPGNERRDHWFASDRNLLSHKFTSTTSVRPHIWRPRAQILGTCRQIHREIISLNCYRLHLNYVAEYYYNTVRKHLTPFLRSHVTTVSSATLASLRNFQHDLDLTALESYFDNAVFSTRLDQQASDKFNGLGTILSPTKDTQAAKDGAEDRAFLVMLEIYRYEYLRYLTETSALLGGPSSEMEERFAVYIRLKIVILPKSLKIPRPDLEYSPYPQLALLTKWNCGMTGEIVEEHWRNDAKTGNNWECLSINKEKCSCLDSTYCSTTMDNEQYCEDWYGNVTGSPAWREPRGVEDDIYPEGYCLFEN